MELPNLGQFGRRENRNELSRRIGGGKIRVGNGFNHDRNPLRSAGQLQGFGLTPVAGLQQRAGVFRAIPAAAAGLGRVRSTGAGDEFQAGQNLKPAMIAGWQPEQRQEQDQDRLELSHAEKLRGPLKNCNHDRHSEKPRSAAIGEIHSSAGPSFIPSLARRLAQTAAPIIAAMMPIETIGAIGSHWSAMIFIAANASTAASP